MWPLYRHLYFDLAEVPDMRGFSSKLYGMPKRLEKRCWVSSSRSGV